MILFCIDTLGGEKTEILVETSRQIFTMWYLLKFTHLYRPKQNIVKKLYNITLFRDESSRL
jgi:hypothetical protein